ncbi:hypothetical protein H6P81_003909 [Aristolochia fimbriata]|uniref:RRM domain-containing protein n=1 Tax=Aristolochia fimbriata TaxID=158543 RepID=A0AAV7FGV2_ARIFI|nr:hypothetical protein H6P81_003909 [Aristolochia fimbriata]
MTVDDDNSIYVGGLPYDTTEDSLRKVFDLYGAVVAIKIINDRDIGGKCYGFITFTNPRAAIHAISDMNGRTIGGRVVRVNEVRTRGGRLNREGFHRGAPRDLDWGRGRDRERDHDRDRHRHRERSNDRSRDNDMEHEREYEHTHDHDQLGDHVRDRLLERDQDRDAYDNFQSDHQIGWDRDGGFEEGKDQERIRNKEDQSMNQHGSRSNDRRNREQSASSNGDYNDQVKEELQISTEKCEELQKQISQMEEKFEERQKLVIDLQKKAQKLENALAMTKKISSQKKTHFTKIQRCFLQMRDYSERLKSCDQELQVLVDTNMLEGEVGEDIDTMADGAVIGVV